MGSQGTWNVKQVYKTRQKLGTKRRRLLVVLRKKVTTDNRRSMDIGDWQAMKTMCWSWHSQYCTPAMYPPAQQTNRPMQASFMPADMFSLTSSTRLSQCFIAVLQQRRGWTWLKRSERARHTKWSGWAGQNGMKTVDLLGMIECLVPAQPSVPGNASCL